MTSEASIESLRNLGPTSAAWLAEIGVHTKADLQRLGPILAYRLVKQRQPKASLNLLWAIQGALTDTDWRKLPDAARRQLRRQVEDQ